MEHEEFHKRVRSVAHDARTPLTTIAGFADLLAGDDTLPDETRDMARTIVEETRRLTEILETFFDEISSTRTPTDR